MKHTPAARSDFVAAYEAAHRGVGVHVAPDRAWVVVKGGDRGSYLQGLFTNDIAALTAGTGCYSAYLTPQGRLIADVAVYELGDVLLLGVPSRAKDTVIAKLEQFVFSEDVAIADATSGWATLVVAGPRAAASLVSVFDNEGVAACDPLALPHFGNVRASFQGDTVVVLQPDTLGVPGFEVLVDVRRVESLVSALRQTGAVATDGEVVDTLRIEAGIPVFGHDMTEETIPLEAGIEARAISFSKGCYVGQEVVIRILHRGHGRVVRKLVGLVIEAEQTPVVGSEVAVDAKPVGVVTSACWSPRLGSPVALAMLHRDVVAPGTVVRIGEARATVSALPFATPDGGPAADRAV